MHSQSRQQDNRFDKKNIDGMKAVAISVISLFPSVSLADDGSNNVFAVPLAISFLTMVPFLYYQQALKPKERTIKQIEVDPVTRKPLDKSAISKGDVGQAQAKKK